MLQASGRKSREITEVTREENALFLISEAGMIRLIPQADRRYGFPGQKTKALERSRGRNTRLCPAAVSVRRGPRFRTAARPGHPVVELAGKRQGDPLETARLRLIVTRATGSIRYERPDGTALLSERAWESKNTEGYDSFRPVINENTRVEEVATPDGVKRRIKEADRVFDRKLYRTRLYLEFAPQERLYGLGQEEEGAWDLRHTTQYLHQANLKIAIPLLLSGNGYGILLSTRGRRYLTIRSMAHISIRKRMNIWIIISWREARRR